MIDENSPLYPKYVEECLALAEETYQKLQALYASMPGYRGRDMPGVYEIRKEENARLREIQKKYGFGD